MPPMSTNMMIRLFNKFRGLKRFYERELIKKKISFKFFCQQIWLSFKFHIYLKVILCVSSTQENYYLYKKIKPLGLI
jgi:hypothetical protein